MTNEQKRTDNIFSFVFGLPPKLCHLLRLFMSVPYATTELIEKELKVKYNARILVLRLRKRLAAHNVVVHSQYGGTYWITKETKKQIKEIIHARL